MSSYRFKRGIVFEARRLTKREVVVTPFGTRSGFPGSYVVKDDYEQEWIVPPEEFSHFLEKVPADSG